MAYDILYRNLIDGVEGWFSFRDNTPLTSLDDPSGLLQVFDYIERRGGMIVGIGNVTGANNGRDEIIVRFPLLAYCATNLGSSKNSWRLCRWQR